MKWLLRLLFGGPLMQFASALKHRYGVRRNRSGASSVSRPPAAPTSPNGPPVEPVVGVASDPSGFPPDPIRAQKVSGGELPSPPAVEPGVAPTVPEKPALPPPAVAGEDGSGVSAGSDSGPGNSPDSLLHLSPESAVPISDPEVQPSFGPTAFSTEDESAEIPSGLPCFQISRSTRLDRLSRSPLIARERMPVTAAARSTSLVSTTIVAASAPSLQAAALYGASVETQMSASEHPAACVARKA